MIAPVDCDRVGLAGRSGKNHDVWGGERHEVMFDSHIL